jgi:hypothetical protein
MNALHSFLELILAFILWAEDFAISYETLGKLVSVQFNKISTDLLLVLSTLEYSSEKPTVQGIHHEVGTRLHSRIDQKLNIHFRYGGSSNSALRFLRNASMHPHPNIFMQLKVHS